MLSAVDIVADPSAPNAFVEGVMEGKEWVWNNGVLEPKLIDSYKGTILVLVVKNWKEISYTLSRISSQS